jgi:uncharacterized membrane protein YhaH (DUF805 family)
MEWYLKVLRKYMTFFGRACREEYWSFVLFQIIITLVIGIIDLLLKDAYMLLSLVYYLVTLIPTIAVSVRRLHDVGRSGWWLLLNIIPFCGIILLIFFLSDSQPHTNAYGPSPKDKDTTKITM